MDMKKEIVLEAVEGRWREAYEALGVRFAGNGNTLEQSFHCPLPGHSNGDQTSSASLNSEKGFWFCQTCGGKGDIFSMAGYLHGHTFFPEQLKKVAQVLGVNGGSQNGAGRQPQIVETYPYCDEQGTLLYEVVRMKPKNFRQRRPDGKGGWIWNMKDVHRVLYRLAELQGIPTVYVVEGEKDADRLWDLERPATCNPMGAGKWLEEYTEQLKAAGVENIVIIPDCDEAGEKHGIAVARSCFKASLKTNIVQLAGLEKGGDVSDWFNAGHARKELVKIVQDTPILLVAPEELSIEEKKSNIKKDRESKKQGQALDLLEPEPWPESVDGAELLGELEETFRRHLALSEGAAETLALWTVFSYTINAFQFSPRLALTSPEKRCGKTTTLGILSRLVFRPLSASNITASAMFRTIESAQPTLLVDEADTFLHDNDELRGILNSGHYRASAYVVRTVGESYESRQFSTWAAIAIAKIGKLPDTLHDRSLIIKMRRKRKEEQVIPFRIDRSPNLDSIAQKTARWAADNIENLKNTEPALPDSLFDNDRAADNWRPLLAIAELAGGGWPERTRVIAVALTASDEGDGDSARALLLSDLRNLFEERGADRLFSADICDVLGLMEDRPWSEWRKGKPITTTQFARQLRPFGITPKTIRIGDDRAKGYLLSELSDPFSRYLPPSTRDTVTSLSSQGNPPIPNRDKENYVTDRNSLYPAPIKDCHGVTARRGGSEQKELWEDSV
jgi:hypothetical protein